MADLLNSLRAANVQPQWEYLNKLLAIQRECGNAEAIGSSARLSSEPAAIDAELNALHTDDRAAILVIAIPEINMILRWCRVQAKIAELRRAHGLG